MEKIKIFAPCDGTVYPIEEIEDAVFSKGLLGVGFFIKPTSKTIVSPVHGEVKEIFHTKHAFVIEFKKVTALIHIGLESVNLEGKPFKVLTEKNKKVEPGDKIVEVDWKEFEKEKISKNTPIVFQSENNKLDFKILKTGIVKVGDVIGEIEFLKLNEKENLIEEIRPINFSSKYDNVALEINTLVGGKANYKKFYNCMTRLRIIIKNKDLVDIEEIKKINIVKGTNWNGEELQIIIGGEVYKVKESLEKQLLNLDKVINVKNNRSNIKDKIFAFLGGVITPILPVLIGAGMLKALQSVLQIAGLITTIKVGTPVSELVNYDIVSILAYLMGDVGLVMIGFFFCYSTIKYLGGNTYVGALVALTMVAPAIFNGQMVFEYFTILDVKVGIKGYTSSVIPQIGAALIYVYFDKWVQKWMPTSVDIVFRHMLSLFVTAVLAFTLVGPALGLLEALIGNMVLLLEKIPLGLGTAIYSGLRQILVITGLHSAITALIGAAGWYSGTSFNLMMAIPMAVFGQLAVCVAVGIRTGNSNLRQAAIGAVPSAIFGITEPVIYGVTLPRIKIFGIGCFASFVGGFICGVSQVHSYSGMGQGILFYTGIFSTAEGVTQTSGEVLKDAIWYTISLVSTIAVGISLTMLLFTERKNELKETKKINKIFIKKNNENKELLKDLKDLESILDEKTMKTIKLCESAVVNKIKLKVKISKVLSKEEKLKEKFAEKSNLYFKMNKLDKVKKYNDFYNSVNFSSKIDEIEKVAVKAEKNYQKSIIELEKIQKKYKLKSDEIINKYTSDFKEKDNFEKKYYNCIHSLDIAYQINEAK